MAENPSSSECPGVIADPGIEAIRFNSPTIGPEMLEAKIVEYSEQADQCTIYPPGLTGIERMEQWLTAETGAFVDLRAWR